MSFAFSRIRDAGDPSKGNLAWTVATDITPRAGLLYPSGANIAYKAPNPNSAKLVIQWLMGDEEGGKGMAEWFVPGNWPSRIDVKNVAEHPFLEDHAWTVQDLNWWYMNPKAIFIEKTKVLEFVQEVFN
jgi:iron(III) transport system substrate-binding protein